MDKKLSAKSKFDRNDIIPLVKYITKIFVPKTSQFEIVGSYRREKQIIGDLEILVTGLSSDNIIKILDRCKLLTIHKILWKGNKKMAFVVSYGNINNLQLEIYITEKKYWPFALLTRTGSGMFNIIMRSKAKKSGLLLNEYGLFNKNGEIIKGLKTEKSIMEYLDMKYHTPSERSI